MFRIVFLLLSIAVYSFSQVPTISQDSLKRLLTDGSPYDFVLIDIRGESELTSMIGNSSCKPYNLVWPDQFQKECERIGKDQVVYLYCRSGSRAGQAVTYIQTLGYTKVFSAGGISTWNGPTLSKTDMLALTDLPKPSMKGTVSPVIYNPFHRNESKQHFHSFICPLCYNLLINNGHFNYDMRGHRQISDNHVCVLPKDFLHKN